jgi:LysR family transcriptional regulator, mexEF-oprN operon transcriptional activator
MKHFDLRRIDLNLLVTFDALMTTRSVTRAAERLGLGQPAVSHALARLRELTEDSLFVASRRGLVPTSRATGLAAWVRSVLEEARQKLLEPPQFDPAQWTGTVRLAMTPMMDMALTPRLLGQLAAAAPHVWVTVQAAALWRDVVDRLDDGAIDLYVGFAGEAKPWHRRRPLWKENVLALFSPARLSLALPVTLEDYLCCSHVLVTQRGGVMERQVDDALARIGQQRRIVLSTPHFLVVPHLLLETPLIATLHGRAARWFAEAFQLTTSPLPLEIPSVEESMVWHAVVDRDPAQLWLRDTILSTAQGL